MSSPAFESQPAPLRRVRTSTPAGATNSWDELSALPSAASRAAFEELKRLARTPIAVTLVGPPGTGKSCIGRGIHESSVRGREPFIMENLSSIPASLAASKLFGHVKGAFTGAFEHRRGLVASAHRGTLALDELAKCPAEVQHGLLGVLDGRGFSPVGADRYLSVDVRFVAMSSVPLDDAVRRGSLIQDLFERLRTTVVRLRPLDERREDILPVARTALRRLYRTYGYTECPRIHDNLSAFLYESRWPGNHRHVVGVIERVLANAQGASTLTRAHLPQLEATATTKTVRERFIADYVAQRPEAHGRPGEVAKFYGVSRPTIRSWTKGILNRGESGN